MFITLTLGMSVINIRLNIRTPVMRINLFHTIFEKNCFELYSYTFIKLSKFKRISAFWLFEY